MGRVIPFRSKRRWSSAAIASAVAGWPAAPYNGYRLPTQAATLAQDGEPFIVGEWLVEPTLNRLSCGDVSVKLELKSMDVLLCLVGSAGEVVAKHDLLDAVWQTEFISDNSLQRRIADLRDALGDDAQKPRYIETIRKRGYRLIAEVGAADPPGEPAAPMPEPPTGERNPYPGLAPFTEADADRFFGREAEVTALWRKVTSRRLLALIGPSGIGKSSLLRAGLAPRAPPDWRVVVLTPGEAPALSLARALAVVSRWQGRFSEAVLVVDQFEELFTLNPPEVQAGFIDLLRRLVDAADVHLVLAMRDDFLYQCERYPQIAPIFKDLTPLGPPGGEALRQALEEPAARLLHRFEGELRVWSLSAPNAEPLQVIPRPEGAPAPYHLVLDPTGLWVYRDRADQIGKGLLWDLSAPPGAQQLELRRSGSWEFSAFDFHPEGDWLAASTRTGSIVSFWPLRRAYPSVVKGASSRRKGLAFSPDGRWLAATWPPGRAGSGLQTADAVCPARRLGTGCDAPR